MKNLEIKVRVENLDVIKSHLGFSKYEKTLEQTDTYFLVGKIQLKVREEKTSSEIIAYIRKSKEGTRESSYYRINIFQNRANFMKTVLRFLFSAKMVVAKKRDLFFYKNTRIHLDTVAGLGEFVELETVCWENKNQSKGFAKYWEEHEKVKQTLSLFRYPAIAGSYSTMMKPTGHKT